jgi:hypothetical protein
MPDSRISLRSVESNEDAILPVEFIADPSGKSGRAVFALPPAGSYIVYVKNPGGLDASLGTFSIERLLDFDIYVSLGYSPAIPLYSEFNKFFDKPIFPRGLNARVTIFPFKYDSGDLGFELAPSWMYLSTSTPSYKASAHIAGLSANLVFRKWIEKDITAMNFRAGGGASGVLDFYFQHNNGETSEHLNVLTPTVGAGVSFLWVIYKPFFVEAGLDFTHLFTVDSSSPGYLRPWLNAGLRVK